MATYTIRSHFQIQYKVCGSYIVNSMYICQLHTAAGEGSKQYPEDINFRQRAQMILKIVP